MISFQCQCGNPITLPDEWANRTVSCRKCHGVVLVPPRPAPVAPPPPPPEPTGPAVLTFPVEPPPEVDDTPRPPISLDTKIGLAAGAMAVIVAALLVVWLVFYRDTWEENHRGDLLLLSEQFVQLMHAGKTAEGLGKFDEIQKIVGKHKLTDPTLVHAIVEVRSLAAEVRIAASQAAPATLVAATQIAAAPPVATSTEPYVVTLVTPATKPAVVTTAPTVSALAEARKTFKTVLTRKTHSSDEPPVPPAEEFSLISYPAPLGDNAAYLTPDPKDGKKHPAIIWIHGGDYNSIGDVWTPQAAANDQTASAFRKAGMVMMFPSLRSGNKNPGLYEGFYGEVDDVIAAAEYLKKQPWVDGDRLYLGGHSTGGTLVLLVAECTDQFRAVFSFGPLNDPSGYSGDLRPPVNSTNPTEIKLRSPGLWLESVRTPTFVLEGRATGQTNIMALATMDNVNKNPKNTFVGVAGADHFSILAPVTKLIAEKILFDAGETSNITLTEKETAKLFGQ